MFHNFKTRDEINSLDDFQVFDVRYQLSDSSYGKRAFTKEHRVGAVFLDLEKDLSGEVSTHGGRHPLPDSHTFQETLRESGVLKTKPILIYDDGDYVSAPRLWWLLKYYGFKDVFVLIGGFDALMEKDLTKEVKKPLRSQLALKEDKTMLASYEEVKQFALAKPKGDIVLVDSRDSQRYLGIVEPIDRKKGHIPGAINLPYKDHYLSSGHLKDQETIKENFKEIDPNLDVIFYCGSGVTACGNIILWDELGHKSRLYGGSFSDYISYDENQVVT